MSAFDEHDLFGEIVRPRTDSVLREKFIMPPFSVLSARDGDWQERKRKWLSLGIKSEVGRGETTATTYSPTGRDTCAKAREKFEAIPGGAGAADQALKNSRRDAE